MIMDTVMPGPMMTGWSAGQLWQLYTMSAHGDHWFCSEDEGAYPNVSMNPSASTMRRMMVCFSGGEGTTAGYEELKQEIVDPNPMVLPRSSYFTTFSRRKVRSGHPEVFSLVVVPHDPKTATPEEIAKGIAITTRTNGSTEAVITIAGKVVTVDLGERDWSVKR